MLFLVDLVVTKVHQRETSVGNSRIRIHSEVLQPSDLVSDVIQFPGGYQALEDGLFHLLLLVSPVPFKPCIDMSDFYIS